MHLGSVADGLVVASPATRPIDGVFEAFDVGFVMAWDIDAGGLALDAGDGPAFEGASVITTNADAGVDPATAILSPSRP